MDLLPVVAGCRALIVGEWPEYAGQECYVLEWRPKGSEHTRKGEPIKMYRDAWAVLCRDGCVIDVGDKALVRIDGNTPLGELEHWNCRCTIVRL